MRPGQEAPDGVDGRRTSGIVSYASMRPGQEAPDGTDCPDRGTAGYDCFNEAGARSPGWRFTGEVISRSTMASMRPGQEAPDGPVFLAAPLTLELASMRPGQEAPDGNCPDRGPTGNYPASMRPGQEAPDGLLSQKAPLQKPLLQ